MNRSKRISLITGASLMMCFFFYTPAFATGPTELWNQWGGEYHTDLQSGAASYSIPIDIPKGRNGLTPSISLQYSGLHTDDTSTLGYGWWLPETRIVRRPLTSIMDMYNDGAFALEMNGSYIKLIDLSLTSGEYGTYGAEVEGNYYYIEFQSEDTWFVSTKEGVEYTFGTSTDSRIDNPSDSTQIYAWYVDEVRDQDDNYISYEYYKDGAVLYPSTINYTGNGTVDGPFTVRFEPFASGAPTARADAQSNSVAGFKLDYQYLLDSIEVDVDGETGPVKTYDLSFDVGDNDYRSLLYSVTVSGFDSDGTEITLEPYEFTYTEATDSWTRDNGTDYDLPEENFYNDEIGIGDFTGDGMADILHLAGSGSSYTKRMWQGSETGFTDISSEWALPDFTFRNSSSVIADFNGDGLTDFGRSIYVTGGGQYAIYLNTGENSFEEVTSSWTVPTTFDFGQSRTRWGDVNGDGLIDVVNLTGCSSTACSTAEVWENDGITGWSDKSSDYSLPPIDFLNQSTYLGDLNGDGLADAYRVSASAGFYVYLNNGDGTWTNVSADWNFPAGAELRSGTTYTAFDVNGDGYMDIYRAGASGLDGVWFGNGHGWQEDTTFSGFAGGATVLGLRFNDFNGDGLTDGMYSTCSSGCSGYVYLHDGEKPDILSDVTTPQGGTQSFEYTPSTRYTNDDGELTNVSLPFVFPTVKTSTKNDGLGNEYSINYSYRDGAFTNTGVYDGRFAGFGSTVETFNDGSKNVTYYHQGGGSDGSALGEYNDSYNKIGQVYHKDIFDESGTKLQSNVGRIYETDLGDGRVHVYNDRSLSMTYDSDGSHVDSATRNAVFDAYGNLTRFVDYGEVTGYDSGYFVDIGDDLLVTVKTYASTITSPYLVGLTSFETVTDYSGAVLHRTNYRYDDLLTGKATKGNLTMKREQLTDVTVHGATTWATQKYSYDSNGNVSKSTDPNGYATEYEYDSWSTYPVLLTDSLGYATMLETDLTTGNKTQIIDPNGTIEQWDYDTFGRLEAHRVSSTTDEASLVTLQEKIYDTAAAPNSISTQIYLDASTSSELYEYYDGLGRLVQTRSLLEDGDYAVADIEYDDEGRVIRTSVAYLDSGSSYTSPDTTQPDTDVEYDRAGKKLSVSDDVGTVMYDYDGRETTVTDEEGNQKTYAYDARGQLVRVDEIKDAITYSTQYEYDSAGNFTGIEDAQGNVREFTYDWGGRRLTASDLHSPSTSSYGTWTYTYDYNGNVKSAINPNGDTIDYGYDGLGRLKAENSQATTGTDIIFTYDTATNGIGKLAEAKRGWVSSAYSYDEQGKTTSETMTIGSNTYTTSYEYDYQGNITSTEYPGGKVLDQFYNVQGLLDSAQFNGVDVVSAVDYNANNQPVSIMYGNGVMTSHTYDSGQRYWRTDTDTFTGTTALQDLNYIYDNVGNITQLTDASVLETAKIMNYTYDDLYRLKNAVSSGSASALGEYDYTYGYDAIGNMTEHPISGVLTYEDLANPHALTGIDSDTWTYDANGNVTATGDLGLNWTYRDELSSSNAGSVNTNYLYDHNGTRRYKASAGNKTYYVGGYIENSDGTQEWHISLLGNPVFEEKYDGTTTTDEWIHTDHLGSVAVTTDSLGDWTTVQDSYPFGDQRVYETSGTELDNRYSFTNKERDEESDLMYFEARYLATDSGRFMSKDPWEGNYSDPQSLNKYAYARNNPARFVDPTGMWSEETGAVESGDTLGAITSQINKLYNTDYSYQDLARLNEIENPDIITIGQVIMPNGVVPDITTDLMQRMHENSSDLSIQNPYTFRKRVQNGGIWDLKSQEGVYCSRQACGGQQFENYIFMGTQVDYDAPGNIHYGYVGSSAWFGLPSVLHSFANNAQNIDNQVNSGDTLSDRMYIDVGIILHQFDY